MPLEWSQELSVSITEIDEQHKKLIAMLNELNAAMRAGKGNAMVGEILERLIQYAATHFTLEERYMDQYGYLGKIPHKGEHAAFVKKVGDFKKDFDAGKAMLSVSIMNFLSDWLKNHITKTDKAYAPFFNSKGLK
jgi:hemerythrin